eukprot:snap_masked-scaffold_22-processed-gene-0.20-mRNA-1 protein AED:1.00 eAED:1.00 QI:0/-1/0/0/-1/1/1/0/229
MKRKRIQAEEKQSYLDLGQQDFEKTQCEKCCLVYCPGVPQDEKLHKRNCRDSNLSEQNLKLEKGNNLPLGSFAAERLQPVRKISSFFQPKVEKSTTYGVSVFELSEKNDGKMVSKLFSLKKKVDQEMGVVNAANKKQFIKQKEKILYYSLSEDGFLLSICVIKGRKAVESLWVAEKYRRKKIATKMMEFLIENDKFIFSNSSPLVFTPEGISFFNNFNKRRLEQRKNMC